MKTFVTVLMSVGLLSLSSMSLAQAKTAPATAEFVKVQNRILIVPKPIENRADLLKLMLKRHHKNFKITGAKWTKNCRFLVVHLERTTRTGGVVRSTLFLRGVATPLGQKLKLQCMKKSKLAKSNF